MILFEEDWHKPENATAIVHVSSANRSWVEFAAKLKKAGIKNHAFMLALINPALEFIDPHSPNLTREEKFLINCECRVNPWYFFREVARTQAQAGDKADFVMANRGNIFIWWCFFCNVQTFSIQPRQTGKSFAIDLLLELLMNIGTENTVFSIMTKDDTLRAENIRRLKDMMDELPDYLRQRDKNDTNNLTDLSVKSMNNILKVYVAQSSFKLALKQGRGLSSPIVLVDEVPYHQNAEASVGSALGSMGAVVRRAKKAGSYYGVVFTTTAGKLDDEEGKWAHNRLMESAPWTENFYDCQNKEELQNMVRKSSSNDVVRIRGIFSHRQLGFTDEWLYNTIKDIGQNDQANDRDFFNRWTNGSTTHPLHFDVINRIKNSQRDDLDVDLDRQSGYIVRWSIPKEEREERLRNGKFIIGNDTSEAMGRDAIGFVIIDVDTLETVGVSMINETNLVTYMVWLGNFLLNHPNTTLVIERRSTGIAILDAVATILMKNGVDPFRRIYNRMVQDAQPGSREWTMLHKPLGARPEGFYEDNKDLFGFATSGGGLNSRKELYGTIFNNAAMNAADVVYDDQLIGQLLALVMKNGRIDHPKDGHDDLVIAWLIAHWFIQRGTNLTFYGIDGTMRKVRLLNEDGEEIEIEDEEQAEYKEEFKRLCDEYGEIEDFWIKTKIRQRLTQLDMRIEKKLHDARTVDELLKNLDNQRRSRQTEQNYKNHNYGQRGAYRTTTVDDLLEIDDVKIDTLNLKLGKERPSLLGNSYQGGRNSFYNQRPSRFF